MDIIPQEATTPLTNVQLAEQILLGIRKMQQEIRENPITILSTHLHTLVREIETLCKEQLALPAHQGGQIASIPALTEGRICHYTAYNGRCLAACVIGHDAESKVDLVVFTNLANFNGVKNFGTQFHQDVAYDAGSRPGTWHWIKQA